MNIKDLNNKLMFIDRVDVYRYTKVKNPDGSTTQKLNIVPDMQDIPCMLSTKTINNTEQIEDVNSLKTVYTIFTDNSHPFKAGDHLKVTRLGMSYKLQSGKPNVYKFHQEISCLEMEWA